MNIRVIPRLGGRLIAALAMTAGVICAGPAGAATFAYAINYQGEPMTCGIFGNLGVCDFHQLIQPVSAVAGDQFHITVSSREPVIVPGSNFGNGFYVSAYDAGATLGGAGGGGPVRSDWAVVGQGVQTTANVLPFGMSQGNQPNRPNGYLGFLSYGAPTASPTTAFQLRASTRC